MVWEVRHKGKGYKQMKKTMKNAITKSTLVKPQAQYTKNEVRSILGLSEGSNLSPKYYPGMGGRGKVAGSAVISYLERASRVKIGRRYASGTVTVVAR